MVEVKDIQPLVPVWPSRPVSDVDKRKPQREPKKKRDDDDAKRDGDDGDDEHRIDEYA